MPSAEDLDLDFAELYRRLEQAESALLQSDEERADRRAEILEARARAVAPAPAEEDTDVLPVLGFSVGGERFAVRMEEVEQVTEARGLAPLPGAPPHVLGALTSRGRLVAVIDLRRLLGLSRGGMVDLGRVIVVREGPERWGLAAEWVEGRMDVARARLQPAPDGPFHAMTEDRLAVLDLSRLGRGRE